MSVYLDIRASATIKSSCEVHSLEVPNVKYVRVEIKCPGFMLFSSIIPVRGDLGVLSLLDRFHNLHPDVANTLKRCGHMYPPIENRYIHEHMDIVIEYSKSEWVRLTRVEGPKEQ